MKTETKQSHAESIDIEALTFLDLTDLTEGERFLAEQIYELSSRLVSLIEDGPDEEE